MVCGEIQLVSYGEENMYLNENPQITFFKIVYRRYTNFSVETVKKSFINQQPNFGKKISCDISGIGDLIHKMWLIIELPTLPNIYNLNGEVDKKIKFAWARKIAYCIIDYVEIEIGGKVISRQWGEWLSILNELNVTNFSSSIDQYIGNVPELYEFDTKKKAYTLRVPMFFWFCTYSGIALPILCLEYSSIRLNVKLNNLDQCVLFSPTNYIKIQKMYGHGIFGETLIQYSNQGISYAYFDSIDIDGTNDRINDIEYTLYIRRITDNTFVTTVNEYYDNLLRIRNILSSTNLDYLIYGLTSKSIYVPICSTNDPKSIYIEKTYLYKSLTNFTLNDIFMLVDYVYVDSEERKKFYGNKHEYVIEQVFYSGTKTLDNLSNSISIEMLNPCKWYVFMGQLPYMLNKTVNDHFNYMTTFMRENNSIKGSPLIEFAGQTLNSTSIIEYFPMSYYNLLIPFTYWPMSKNTSGYGVSTFSLYPENIQASGSCNMSSFNTWNINVRFNKVDNINKYLFKCYAVSYNVLKIVHGVSGTIFNSNYG